MLKKIILILAVLVCIFTMASCSKETKTLTCDGCGKTVEVEADSNMEEDWLVFCEECGDIDI